MKTSELLANLVTSFARLEDLCQTILPSAEDKTGSTVNTASGNELTQTPQAHHFAAGDKLEATQTAESSSSQPSPLSLIGTLSFPRFPSSSQIQQSPFSSESFLEQDTLDMEKEVMRLNEYNNPHSI